jgi:hypothetical protein
MHYYHRGPSRLLWFFIGAGAATWWIKRKDCDKRSFGPCRRLPPSSRGFPQGAPASNSVPPYPYPPPAPATPSAAPSAPDPANPSSAEPPKDQVPVAPTAMNIPPPIWEWEKRRDWEWEQDKENFVKMSNQAADAVRISLDNSCMSLGASYDVQSAFLSLLLPTMCLICHLTIPPFPFSDGRLHRIDTRIYTQHRRPRSSRTSPFIHHPITLLILTRTETRRTPCCARTGTTAHARTRRRKTQEPTSACLSPVNAGILYKKSPLPP